MKKFVRKTNRLQVPEIYNGGYWYFITICVSDKSFIFDLDNSDILSKIVIDQWMNIPNFYQGVILDEFVLMPNHLHRIIGLNKPKHLESQKSETLGSIISRFKNNTRSTIVSQIKIDPSSFSKKIEVVEEKLKKSVLHSFNYHKLWQKSYHDYIIRNESELYNIRKYIIENPMDWAIDALNPNKR